MEADKIRYIFNEEESKQIIEGTLDVTKFFENKEESTKRLMDALKGRPVYPGHKDKEDILLRASKIEEEAKALRLNLKIYDPSEYASWKIGEVSYYYNKYRRKLLTRTKIGNDFMDYDKTKRQNQQVMNASL